MSIRHFITSILFSALLFSSAQAAQTCVPTSVFTSNIDINGISGLADGNLFVVGDNRNGTGQISIFSNGLWVPQTDPDIPNEDLLDIFVFDATNAVVVGDDGAVTILVNGDWIDISISDRDYNTVWAYSNTDIFIAGDRGRIYHWDGTNWAANTGWTSNLGPTAGTNNNDDFIDSWGDSDTVYFLTDQGSIFTYDRLTYGTNFTNSVAWSENTTCAALDDYDINGFTTDGAGNFYLVGEKNISGPDRAVILKWNVGTGCSEIYYSPSSNTELNAISLAPNGSFTAVGDDGLVVTSSDGITWAATTEGTADINAVWASPNSNFYYAADNGAVQSCAENKLHFSIVHDGAASTCVTEEITIAFHDASTNHTPVTNTRTINLTTSTNKGDWSVITATNTITNNGNGSASYTFAAGDAGTITLGLTSTVAETLNITVVDNADATVTNFITENPSLIISGSTTGTFIDTFSTQRYDNSDGTINWTTSWVEVDGDGAGPTAGNARVGGNRLRLDDRPDTGLDTSVTRTVDLSTYTNAVFSFDYATTNGVDDSDAAVVEVLYAGDASWTILETFTNINGSSNGSRSFTLDNSKFTNPTQIRFRISNLYGGNGERFEVDNVQIAVDSPPSCLSTIHHYEIRHDGSGLTCDPENIIVRACADVDCNNLYNQAITVIPLPAASTSVSWSPDPQIITANNATTLELAYKTLVSAPPATFDTVTLDITPLPASGNPSVCKSIDGTTTYPDCNINFYDSGFIYNTDNSIAPQTSCEASPISTPITIRAVRKDVVTQKCVSLFPGTLTKSINFSVSPAPNPEIYMNRGQANEAIFTSAATTQAVNLSFVDSVATFDLSHDNAGQFTLDASHTDATSGVNLLGSSTFVVKPHSFYLQGYYDNAGADVDLNNITETGIPYWKASDNFRLKLRGQCQNGTITTNYVPTNAQLQVERVLPAAGVNKNLTLNGNNYLSTGAATWYDISADFYQGAVTNVVSPAATDDNSYADAAYHEVGVLNLHVQDTNYFGTSIAEQILPLGRFTPHHFDTVVTDGCTNVLPLTSFTYSGQAITVQTIAMNNLATPTITENYNGNFAKNVTLSTPSAIAGSFNGTEIISAADFVGGAYIKNDVAYTFSTKESGPDSTFTFRASDTDGVTSNDASANEGITNLRSGRMRLENVFGSELTPLIMPLNVEYYSSTVNDFILNTDDTCSTYDATAGTLTNYTGNLASPETTVTGAGTVSAGQAYINFSAPNAGNDGTVNLLANNVSSWLLYDYLDCDNLDGDNNITTGVDTGACATASFGLYRGDDRVIYWREVF